MDSSLCARPHPSYWGKIITGKDCVFLEPEFCVRKEACMDVRVGPYRKLSTVELLLSNSGAGEDS